MPDKGHFSTCLNCGQVFKEGDIHACTPRLPRQPFKCPVCDGSGIVRQGFYFVPPNGGSGEFCSSSTGPEKCRACNGSGIIWG